MDKYYLRLLGSVSNTKGIDPSIQRTPSSFISAYSTVSYSYSKRRSTPENVNTNVVIRLFLSLGFLISWKRSDLITSQASIFLGKHFLAQQGLVLPPQEKFQNLCSRVHLFLSQKTVTARTLFHLVAFTFDHFIFIYTNIGAQLLRIGTFQFRLFIRTCLPIFYGGLFKGTF